jgi:hypothetical protein
MYFASKIYNWKVKFNMRLKYSSGHYSKRKLGQIMKEFLIDISPAVFNYSSTSTRQLLEIASTLEVYVRNY